LSCDWIRQLRNFCLQHTYTSSTNMSIRELISHRFSHSWSDCALASWKKWPNPQRPDVLSVDLINKEYDEETGVLRATRLIIMRSWIPNWLQPIVGTGVCFFVEESITDPRNQRLILKGRNVTLANVAEMKETCVYTAIDDDHTLFEQEGSVKSYTFGLKKKIERFCLDRFVAASAQGREIMEQTIRRIKTEGLPLGITLNIDKPIFVPQC
jgi:hypothetical protein